jgi:tetratricopeptide (TPR) repeat protein
MLREVFIASNFTEFLALREELKQRIDSAGFARAVDLNRNEADARSPLRRSIGRVRSSDLVVLLVGTQYGQDRPDRKHSYTHLEYLEARAEGLPVLPYFIGPDYSKSERQPQRGDPQLNPLERDVLAYRSDLTIAFHDADAEPAQLADTILDRIREVLLSVQDGAAEDDEDLGGFEHDSFGENDLQRLERGKRPPNPLTSQLELLCRPAEAAAAEQLRESRRARQARDRSTAIHHLRKALALRPLDLDAGYELGRLLLTSTRHKHLREASKLAQRVARVAATEGNEIRQGFALALAASAEARQHNEERALAIAAQAIEAADRVAAIHIEYAAICARLGRFPEAIQEARRAFVLRPASFWKMQRHPLFSRSPEFRTLAGELLGETRETTGYILGVELEAVAFATAIGAQATALGAEAALASLPRLDLAGTVNSGRESARRTQEALRAISQRLPEKRGTAVELRDAASRLAAEQPRILAEPIRQLQPPFVDRVCLAAPAALTLLISLAAGSAWSTNLTLVVASIAIGWLSRELLRRRQRGERVRKELGALEIKLAAAELVAGNSEAELSQTLDRFAKLVAEFERHAVAPSGGIFSPSVGPGNAGVDKQVRFRPSAVPRGFRLNRELFPPGSSLSSTVDDDPSHTHQLFRIARREGDDWVANRWGCYFDEPHD